jgi:hypothetical protein
MVEEGKPIRPPAPTHTGRERFPQSGQPSSGVGEGRGAGLPAGQSRDSGLQRAGLQGQSGMAFGVAGGRYSPRDSAPVTSVAILA